MFKYWQWSLTAVVCLSALVIAQTNTQTKTDANTKTDTKTNADTSKKGADASPPAKALLTLDVAKGWVDATTADKSKTMWKVGPGGVSIDFPAVAKGEWINFFLPVREGAWPKEGTRIVFRARADKAVKMSLRLNEMPGAADGKRDRHDEWEAHVVAFEVGPQWRDVELDLRDARKLWGHDGGNGKLDLDRVTGLGFEPASSAQAVHFEVSMVTVLPGAPRAKGSTEAASPHAPAKFRIVFNSDRGGDYEIYAMDDKGANLDRLTNHPGYDLWPAPSPDGKRIAWMTNRDGDYEIYVMNADGSDPVNVSKSPKSQEGHPTWSPDGKQLAFTSDKDGDMELYIMDTDGGNWRRLTNSKGSDGLPTFSPDGKQIIFVSERDNDHEIYRINVDGTGLTRLTNRKGLDTMPAWSPDGMTVAFVSDRDGEQAIFLMDPDGRNVRRLPGPKGFAAWPDWSPDGKSICFHALVRDHFSICTVDIGGDHGHAHLDVLTRGRGANRNPRFAVLVEDSYSPPAIPAGGIRVAASVHGYLRSGAGGPNPQKYPFRYRGYAVLDKVQLESLAKARDGDVPPALAKALGQALLWPGVGDSLESIRLSIAAGKLKGQAKVLHKYGKQGTHTIAVNLEGSVLDGKITLKSVKPFIDGTWDWGGGIAKQEGEVEIAFEVQTAGKEIPHTIPTPRGEVLRTPRVSDPNTAPPDPPVMGALKLTAVVDGFTQATQFNTQKYPFKYSGTSVLTAEQINDLTKAGPIPEATAKALLGCLLWPKANDSLQKIALTSDGKKVTGKVEVLHTYGQQGTHVLNLRVEGTIADGQWTLQVLEPTVSGSWNWGGGSMMLGGKVQITIKAEK